MRSARRAHVRRVVESERASGAIISVNARIIGGVERDRVRLAEGVGLRNELPKSSHTDSGDGPGSALAPRSIREWGKPFKPGQSGNPTGRPKGVGLSAAVRKKAGKDGERLVQGL